MTWPEDPVAMAAAGDRLAQALVLRDRLTSSDCNDLKALVGDFPELASVVFRNAPFAGCDLRGQDLRGLDFTGANLVGARFSGARIAGARFDQARVARWQLRQAADWLDHAAGWRPPALPAAKMVTEGDRFSDTPFSPEMTVIPVHRGVDDVPIGALFEEERTALQEGRLAAAILPVTSVQYAAFQLARDRFHGWHDDGIDIPRLLPLAETRHYLDWLRKVSAADYRLPSAELWLYLARRGGPARCEDAVTIDSHRGLTGPLPADTRNSPGQDRSNRLGLFDMIGNVREFVSDRDGKVRVIGGGYDESYARASNLEVRRDADERHLTRFNGLRLIRLFPPGGR